MMILLVKLNNKKVNPLKILTYRIIHKILKLGISFIRTNKPEIIRGEKCTASIISLIKDRFLHPLIVVTPSIIKHKLDKEIIRVLKENEIEYNIFSHVYPNPTFDLVFEGVEEYNKNKCDCLIAFGGGSALDLAKIIGIYVNNKKLGNKKIKGLVNFKNNIPYFIAIPTTAGSGSEITLAAVIIDSNNNDKYAVTSPKIIPNAVILDNYLLSNLPRAVISTTGMDALTHAIESYLSLASTKFTRKKALQAIKLINENLVNFYNNPERSIYRANMQEAAFLAGESFTRAFVGYVHALAHALGGKYNVPHGLANAILLPKVLEAYGKKIYSKLSKIYDYVFTDNANISKKEKALYVIKWINNLNKEMNINDKFDKVIKNEDLDFLVSHAIKEANPSYPVPKILNKKELVKIYKEVM